MSDRMFWLLVGVLPIAAFCCGYNIGEMAGINEVKHLIEEQQNAYRNFRDTVFRLFGIEVSDG